MDIPEKFKGLPEIGYEELLSKLRSGEPLNGYLIQGDAISALHRSFFEEIPVKLISCRIEGDLDFTIGTPVSLTKEKWITEDLQEIKDHLYKRGITKVARLEKPLEITESYISGKIIGEGVAFPEVSFYGSTVRIAVNFQNAIFGRKACFERTTLGDEPIFSSAIFGAGANFVRAKLGDDADFDGATFGDNARFERAIFGNIAGFIETTFGDGAGFFDTTFGEETAFVSATFGDKVKFVRATYGDKASFDSATFRGSADFIGQRGRGGKEEIPVFIGEVDFRNIILEAPKKVAFQHVNLRKARFLETSMDEIKFVDVDWTEREGRKCVYDEIAEKPSEKDFALIARLYRQLKKNYEDQRDYPGAGDFHYGEMEMTLKQEEKELKEESKWWPKGKKWFAYFLTASYKFLSGYGEKVNRALVILLVIMLSGVPFYSIGMLRTNQTMNWRSALWDGFVSSLGYMTFRISQPPEALWAKPMMALQAILGPIQLALAALALRRKFRR